jgi:hypothetical protein
MRPTRAVPGEDDQAEENRLTSSLAGLVMALLIVVAGLFLFIQLRDKARIEDCLLSGRTNCDAVVAALR